MLTAGVTLPVTPGVMPDAVSDLARGVARRVRALTAGLDRLCAPDETRGPERVPAQGEAEAAARQVLRKALQAQLIRAPMGCSTLPRRPTDLRWRPRLNRWAAADWPRCTDTLLMAAFGAGYAWGSVVWRW